MLYKNGSFTAIPCLRSTCLWCSPRCNRYFRVCGVPHYARWGSSTNRWLRRLFPTANVIGQTAETVQTKQSLFDDALATLVSSRKVIEELRVSAQNQTTSAPKYAEGLRVTSEILTGTGDAYSKLGDGLMFPCHPAFSWRV